MPNNLTDAEIKKALECYRGQKMFAFNGKKPEIYIHDIIDLINSLEGVNEKNENIIRIADKTIETFKAENENLKAEVERVKTLNSKLEAENYGFKVKERENPLEMALLIDEQAENLKTVKAEIINILAERQVAKQEVDRLSVLVVELQNQLKTAKVEAYKEFAERLKEYATQGFWETDAYVGTDQIDNLLKELVGDADGKNN